MWFSILIVVFLFTVLCIGLGFWGRCINQEVPEMIQEDLFCFYLVRKVPTRKGVVTSTHTIELMTNDPFRTQEVILDDFPGWFCYEIESPVDRDFHDLYCDGRR